MKNSMMISIFDTCSIENIVGKREKDLLKSSFIDDEKPIRQKVHFLTLNGINGSDQSRTSLHLTDKVRNQETN